jgi:hypothetical protein
LLTAFLNYAHAVTAAAAAAAAAAAILYLTTKAVNNRELTELRRNPFTNLCLLCSNHPMRCLSDCLFAFSPGGELCREAL